MTTGIIKLDPCVSDVQAQALLDVVRHHGRYGVYVAQPVEHGIGKGLVRRHDALMHYVTARASTGQLESMREVSARTNLFRAVFAEGRRAVVPEAEAILYDHPPFHAAAAALSGRSLVVPDMLYANLLLPGQELAVHTDTPEYRGMSKAAVPEWFLVVMAHSGLFEHWRVHIAGGVTFLQPPVQGGAFVVYPHGPAGPRVRVGLKDNTAVLLDADSLFHGVERVGGPDAPAPPLEPSMHLTWSHGGWDLVDGDDIVARYGADEVRLSLQWKAHCFADAVEQRAFEDRTDELTMARALETLAADLRRKGLVAGELPGSTALAMLLMQTYVMFPEAAC